MDFPMGSPQDDDGCHDDGPARERHAACLTGVVENRVLIEPGVPCMPSCLTSVSSDDNEGCTLSVKTILEDHYNKVVKCVEIWLGHEEEMLARLLSEHQASVHEAPSTTASADLVTEKEAQVEAAPPFQKRANTGRVSRSHYQTMNRQSIVKNIPSEEDNSDPRLVAALHSPAFAIAEACRRSLTNKKMEKAKVHFFKALSESWQFECFYASLIIANAALIGLELSYRARGEDDSSLYFALAQRICSALFFVELVCRIIANGREFVTGPGRCWNAFDVFLVVSSLVDCTIELVHMHFDGRIDGTPGISTARILRIVRITRLVRVLRIARLIRFVRALRVLIFSIAETMKSVIWAIVLLLLIIYFFGVLFTTSTIEYLQMDGQDPHMIDYWGSLDVTMLTLLQSVTNGLDWGAAAKPLGQANFMLVIMFIFYILFCSFAVLNVITGVFCQGAMEGKQFDRDLMVQQVLTNKRSDLTKVTDMFKNLLQKMDTDSDGQITPEELTRHFKDDSFQALLAMLELNTSDAWMLFGLLGQEDTLRLQPEQFVDGCMRLRGTARSIDLAMLDNQVRKNYARIQKTLAEIKAVLPPKGTIPSSALQNIGQVPAQAGTQGAHVTPRKFV